GSLGFDLAAAVDVTIVDQRVDKIPTGVWGPIIGEHSGIGALLVGRSSTGLAGLMVLPGVIDADYKEEIQIMAYALMPPITVTKGTRVAQLVLIQQIQVEGKQNTAVRQDKGFGSSGQTVVSLVQQMRHRPMISASLRYHVDAIRLTMIADTGADVTIIS
ncbi:hypothetical protein N331_03313, partial [Merops nubicus]